MRKNTTGSKKDVKVWNPWWAGRLEKCQRGPLEGSPRSSFGIAPKVGRSRRLGQGGSIRAKWGVCNVLCDYTAESAGVVLVFFCIKVVASQGGSRARCRGMFASPESDLRKGVNFIVQFWKGVDDVVFPFDAGQMDPVEHTEATAQMPHGCGSRGTGGGGSSCFMSSSKEAQLTGRMILSWLRSCLRSFRIEA